MTTIQTLQTLQAPSRLQGRDPSLFSADPEVQEEVRDNLGFTALAAEAKALLPEIRALAGEFEAEGLSDVVLLGMGGSSLASLVLGTVIGPTTAGPRLHVLDTTSPLTVQAVLDRIDFASTAVLVSSKSGTTIEPLSLYAVFRAAADAALGSVEAGRRFVAATDPGSRLEALAHDQGFRAVVSTPPTVGGRYSALTAFGLVPAAMIGIDLDMLVAPAASMEAACGSPVAENPAARLAAFAVDAHVAGRDKLTLVASPGLGSFGLWVEQLVAESLGKEGTGIVPVVDLSPDKPFAFGPDAALAIVRYSSDERLAQWASEWRAHYPVIELELSSPYDVGAEFVRWEHAVAMMGPLLGVNPFGQPNVAAAKAATAQVLEGAAQVPAAQTSAGDAKVTFAGTLEWPGHAERNLGTALGHVIASLGQGDYLAVLAYLPDDEELLGPLLEVVPPAAAQLGAPITFELGPRYLHSTGQLHKGGPDSGAFVLVTTCDAADVEVPGEPWGLGALHRAQAEGDLMTLAAAGRRVMRLDLPDASPDSIAALARGLADATGIVTEER